MNESDNDSYDSDSSSLPSCHSSKSKSASHVGFEPSPDLISWEVSVKEFISFRLTWHDKLDHSDFLTWIRGICVAGLLAPEKGKTGNLHYQGFLIGINKKKFDNAFREYKVDRHWFLKEDKDGPHALMGGNKLQSTTPGKNIRKLAPYCLKENLKVKNYQTWGIPPFVLEEYSKLSYQKHDTEAIEKEMEKIDEDYLLNEGASPYDLIDSYFELWKKYNKNFNIRWLISHSQLLNCKKYPNYQHDLVKQIASQI